VDDAIRFPCPSCCKRLKAPITAAGRSGRCPCGAKFSVPTPTAIVIEPDPHSGVSPRPNTRLPVSGRTAVICCLVLVCGAVLVASVLRTPSAPVHSQSAKGEVPRTPATTAEIAQAMRTAEARPLQETESRAVEERRRAERDEATRRQRELAEERKSLARRYANEAGSQVMDGVGGGQDLVVTVTSWEFDNSAGEFIINMAIAFNGAIFRSNSYSVDGILTLKEDGRSPRFSRTYANDKFRKLESRLKWAAGAAAAVIVLNEMSKQ
jgi:hypothetical protein